MNIIELDMNTATVGDMETINELLNGNFNIIYQNGIIKISL